MVREFLRKSNSEKQITRVYARGKKGNYKLLDFSKMPEADFLIDYIYKRYRQGHYTLIFLIGLPNTGKSSCSQRGAELESIKVHGENRITPQVIVDTPADFVREVMTAEKPGKQIIAEEVGVLFPSRRAMSKDNVNIGKVLDTCRKKVITVWANAPIWNSIDSHMRAMGHVLIECLYIDKKQEVVVFKPFILQTNPQSGKTYKHRFQRNGKEVHRGFFRKPNSKTWNEYEDKKDEFMNNLYKGILLEQEKKDEKLKKEFEKTAPRTIIKSLTAMEMQVHAFLQQGLTQKDVADRMGKEQSQISRMVKNIKRKTKITKEK